MVNFICELSRNLSRFTITILDSYRGESSKTYGYYTDIIQAEGYYLADIVEAGRGWLKWAVLDSKIVCFAYIISVTAGSSL